MHPLLIAWGAVALLIVGVRIGHHFGHKDALQEMQSPRRRELREVSRWLDADVIRVNRQRAALAVLLLIAATAAAFSLRH